MKAKTSKTSMYLQKVATLVADTYPHCKKEISKNESK